MCKKRVPPPDPFPPSVLSLSSAYSYRTNLCLRCFIRAVAPALSTALPCTYVEDAGNATLYFVLKLVDPSALALFTDAGRHITGDSFRSYLFVFLFLIF
jgi:hypothetical protein